MFEVTEAGERPFADESYLIRVQTQVLRKLCIVSVIDTNSIKNFVIVLDNVAGEVLCIICDDGFSYWVVS